MLGTVVAKNMGARVLMTFDVCASAKSAAPRKPYRLVWVLAVCWLGVVGLLAVGGAQQAHRIRADARQTTLRAVENLSLLAAEAVTSALERAQWTLADLAAAAPAERAQLLATMVRPAHVHLRDFRLVEAAALERHPTAVGGLILTPAPEGSPSDAPFLIAHRLSQDAAVAASFDVGAVARTIDRADPPAHWSLLIFTRAGVTLTRWPAATWPVGQAQAQRDLAPIFERAQRIAAAGGGASIELSPYDGLTRLAHHRPLLGAPLVVTVTLSLEDEEVHTAPQLRNLTLGAGMAAGAATLLFGLLIAAAFKRDRVAAQALAESRSKSAFLAALSHELRTPLNAVIGFSELTIMDAPPEWDESILAQLGLIHSSGVQLQSVVDRALDFVWIDSSGTQLQHESLSWGTILSGLEAGWLDLAAAQGQELSLGCAACPLREADCHGCHVYGDPFAARRVTEAMACFAAHAAGPGGRWGLGFAVPDDRTVCLEAWHGPRPDQQADWRPLKAVLSETGIVYDAAGTDFFAMEAGLRLAVAMGWRVEVSADQRAVRAIAPAAPAMVAL